jgi:glucose-6-phosphate-specific signal transduction histidine kinase
MRDNEQGFTPTGRESFSVGLASIRERLRELEGTLEIQSDHGTKIIANVPVEHRGELTGKFAINKSQPTIQPTV